MPSLVCQECGTKFQVEAVNGHRYCSEACKSKRRIQSQQKYRLRLKNGQPRGLLTCPVCNNQFKPAASTSIYCSPNCQRAKRKKASTCIRCLSSFNADRKGQKLCAACREAPCKADGCELRQSQTKVSFSSGYCNPHYLRFMTHGDPLGGKPSPLVLKALDHEDGTRTCAECKRRKPLGEFYKDKSATLGRKPRCKECILTRMGDYYSLNQDEKKTKQRVHRRRNIDSVREQDRQRYERDKEKRIALVENQMHKRRARRNQVPFEEGITRLALRKRDGDNCAYCGVEMNFTRAKNRKFIGRDATIEHRLPLSRGGKHVWANVVLACRDCNMSKNQKTEEEFLVYKAEIEALGKAQAR